MIFYTSDLHFGHENVIRFDNRPFRSVSEMDYTLIHLWNSRVQPDDTVYIVGDFAYRNTRPAEWYLQQLQGKKHLLIGNHDQALLDNSAAVSYFESIEKMCHVTDGKNQICLCHFPICEWNGYRRGICIFTATFTTGKTTPSRLCAAEPALSMPAACSTITCPSPWPN